MNLDDRNAELDQKLAEHPINEQVAVLAAADKRRKGQVRLLAISLILDALLTVAFGFMTIRTNHIAAQAESNASALKARCESTNDARAKNAKLWDYLIDQNQNVPRTPDKQKFFDDFVTLKNETFAPSDCSKVL